MRDILARFKTLFLVSVILLFAINLPKAYADEPAITNLKQIGRAFASVAKAVSPAVVNVQSDQSIGPDGDAGEEGEFSEEDIPPPYLDFFRNMDPRFQPYPYRRQAVIRQGSGFIISKDGYIVTNNHLVQNASKITIKLLDDREFIAKVVGTDPQSDIAVLKIDATNLPTVTLGNSDEAEVGEWVVALGNPFGLSHSLSAGILSAKGRSSVGIADYENFLQTDAAINPGNSGGPLLDLEGQVIGINTAIYSRSGGYMGIGFAIPINMAKGIIDQLMDKGTVVRGYLGVKIQELTTDLAKSFGLSDRKGILVAQLEANSPAEKGGLKQGDIILSLDGKPVENIGDFRNAIASSKPGSEHTIVVLRDKKNVTLRISVGNLDTGPATSKNAKTQDSHNMNSIGISVQTLTGDIASKIGAKPGVGVVISKVKPGSIAELAGLSRGAVILEVNRKKVNSVKEFSDEVNKAAKNKSILFLVQDQFGTRYIVINIG